MRSINILVGIVIGSFSLVACSSDTSTITDNNENTSIETMDVSLTSNEEDVYHVAQGFFDFSVREGDNLSNESLDALWDLSISENHDKSDDAILALLEDNYDLNDYVNYDSLDNETKIIVHEKVINNKLLTSMMGPVYDYDIDPEKITVNGDNAVLNGDGIKVTIDLSLLEDAGLGTEGMDDEIILGQDYTIHFIKKDGEWEVDGNKLDQGLGMDNI